MKRSVIPFLGGLLVLILSGVGVMIAQESRAIGVAVSPPPDSRITVMHYNNDDEDEPLDVELLQSEPLVGSEMAAPQSPEHGNFVFRLGEGDGAWLGVTLSDVTAEKAKELKLSGEYGVIVKEVRENSPAAKAGLQKDDVILEFAGEKVRSAAQFRRLVRETPPDRNVTLVVSRAGQSKTLSAKLEARSNRLFHMPATPAMPAMPAMPEIRIPDMEYFGMTRGARLGISADELTPQLAAYFGVKQGKGILVREVVVGSAGEKAGLKAGDVIVAVDGKEVASVGNLRRALAGDKPEQEKRKVTLTIVRDRREQSLTVELEPAEHPSSRRVALGIDPVQIQKMAAEVKAHAKEYEVLAQEWQKHGQEFQNEQKKLREELRHLQEELPRGLDQEIKRQLEKLKLELQVV